MADSNSNKSASNTSSDQVSMQITSVKLNGHNYLLWAQAIKVALGARKSNGSFSWKILLPYLIGIVQRKIFDVWFYLSVLGLDP